jgi:hypothetical protein
VTAARLALALLLCALPLAAHDPPPYDRGEFGGWIDADHDCQDTRSEALRIAGAVTGECSVDLIIFIDPYSGEPYDGPASALDIDHVVPLGEAWRSGAWAWTDEERRAFANDLDNLLPTSASLNRSKKDRDPALWLPPYRGAHCGYARVWVAVKARYELDVDGDELAALVGLLATCEAMP